MKCVLILLTVLMTMSCRQHDSISVVNNIVIPEALGSCSKKNSIGMVFCDIPAGTFTMGSPDNEDGRQFDEGPQHKVTFIRDFEMLSTEVTQSMWKDVVGSDPFNPGFRDHPTHPVEMVSWKNVTEDFIPKLNEKLKAEGYQYRLPTENEWEYAARGEKTGPFGIDGEPKDFCWFDGNSGRKTNPVGKLKPNKYGLFDMHGNVSEWVQDVYSDYKKPVVVLGDYYRVIRGGNWIQPASFCRSAVRSSSGRDNSAINVGFRLVRTRN